jgi:hypothetical protein
MAGARSYASQCWVLFVLSWSSCFTPEKLTDVDITCCEKMTTLVETMFAQGSARKFDYDPICAHVGRKRRSTLCLHWRTCIGIYLKSRMLIYFTTDMIERTPNQQFWIRHPQIKSITRRLKVLGYEMKKRLHDRLNLLESILPIDYFVGAESRQPDSWKWVSWEPMWSKRAR